MGAQLWHHAAPWQPDPEESLLEFQTRFLAEMYDLPALVPRRLESARQAVRDTEAGGDEYDLLEFYREELAMLEEVASRPIPDDPRQRIELVRKIYASSGEGVGNVLDVTGISGGRDISVAERLGEAEMTRLVGTTRPDIAQARHAIDKVNEELGRGECVCFPYYEGGEAGPPVGWYFIGNTFD